MIFCHPKCKKPVMVNMGFQCPKLRPGRMNMEMSSPHRFLLPSWGGVWGGNFLALGCRNSGNWKSTLEKEEHPSYVIARGGLGDSRRKPRLGYKLTRRSLFFPSEEAGLFSRPVRGEAGALGFQPNRAAPRGHGTNQPIYFNFCNQSPGRHRGGGDGV